MHKIYNYELAGRTLSVEIGKVAELANGAALVRYGETVVLVAATASEKPRAGIDFFPLSIDYEERHYSVGKIPGGFIKREGRPTEKAILTSRVIDRPIRPLFPKDYRNDVSVVATVLCVDQDAAPEVAAMLGASIALSISDIPFNGPTAALNIGLIDGEYIINPTSKEREATQLQLTVASTAQKVMMIEAGANEVSNDVMYDAIMFAHAENVKLVEFINTIVADVGKEKKTYEQYSVPADLYAEVKAFITDARMETAVFHDEKQARDAAVSALTDEAAAHFAEKYAGDDPAEFNTTLGEAMYKFEKETVRRMILKDNKRPDGRRLDEIRRLEAEVDILPRTHGSALFRRGQTQVLTITTLGTIGDAQRLDGLDFLEDTKRYMHHYNFPGYSVGEAKSPRSPGRREIGHGALAERALVPVLPTEEAFPYAIRCVSEVVSSNGSTSQGSVCASTLSLMAAGVPITAPVAGISVGLITGETPDDFVLLTDIQGLEDFFGDMDFKVAGTKNGITAIQMDIKIDGLTPEIIRRALDDTLSARLVILNECMNQCITAPRSEVSPYAPKVGMVQIDPEMLAAVIGAKGKVIKRIIEESGVQKIDTEDDGRIFIADTSQENIDKAIGIINAIVKSPEVGTIYQGKVTRLMNFGAFVEIAPEKEGLVHISQLSTERVPSVEDAVKVGDIVNVRVTDIDEQGRVNLSIKATFPGFEHEKAAPRAPRERRDFGADRFGAGDRYSRGDRFGGGDRPRYGDRDRGPGGGDRGGRPPRY